jgi:hypothetical protein
MNPFFLQF